ncbi:molybdopterin-guanine dinucleotide biosynthesis protein B [bacterium]|nr:molybdopterin-guanine dinucleotide biosynthesis protein B [bacterium]
MFERAIIHVAGPAGAGKTAFIEQLVHALRAEEVACVRGIADTSAREPSESAPEGQPELDRWRRAGATVVALYRFDPGDGSIADDFYATDVMATFARVMVIEGDSPVDTVDLEVFVARPPGPGATLLRRARRDQAAERQAQFDAMMRTMATADRLLGGAGKHMLDPEVAAEARRAFAAGPAGESATAEKWQLAAGYEGLARAQLVIANLFSPDEQALAAPFLREVARLRKDQDVFDDVISWRGSRVAITAVAGNVLDAKDPELRKAVARVRRGVRGVG